MSVVFGFGGGVFSAPQEIAAGTAPAHLAVADFDEDGLDDIVVPNRQTGELRVLLSLGH